VEPPTPYPEDTLTHLANVFNDQARQFYARHGVSVIAAAYESHEEQGEVSLMITKPCEMHVVGKIKRAVLNEAKAQPMTFYKTRPDARAAH